MIIVYAVLAALSVAVVQLALAGGRAGQLQIPRLRWISVALPCLLVQLYLATPAAVEMTGSWRTPAMWLSQVGIAVVALANVRQPWMALLTAGLLLNLAVMTANGGLMPVSPETLIRSGHGNALQITGIGQPKLGSKDVILPQEETRLAFLADRFVVPFQRASFSLGDVFIAAGAFMVLQAAVAIPKGVSIEVDSRGGAPAQPAQPAQPARRWRLQPLPWSTGAS